MNKKSSFCPSVAGFSSLCRINPDRARCGLDTIALHIGFNAEYLLEFLRAAGAATSISMQVRDA